MTTSTTTILSPDKIKTGNFITVLEWTSHRDNSYKGDVLEVTAINLPFLVCKRHTGGWSSEKPLTLNTDQVQLTSLSKEFVDAALGRKTETVCDKAVEKASKIEPNMYVYEPYTGIRLVENVYPPSLFTAIGYPNTQYALPCFRPATHDEIKAHLIAEAEKRGIRVGVKVIEDNSKSKSSSAISFTVDSFELRTASSISNGQGSGYDKDHFEQIQRPFLSAKGGYSLPVEWLDAVGVMPTLSITVKGKTYVPKFCDGYVEFGCAKITNDVFVAAHQLCETAKHAYVATNVSGASFPNRYVESICIGKGDFSPELIAGIVAEIEKRADDGWTYHCNVEGKPFGASLYYHCIRTNRDGRVELVYADRTVASHIGYGFKSKILPNRAAAEALIRAK